MSWAVGFLPKLGLVVWRSCCLAARLPQCTWDRSSVLWPPLPGCCHLSGLPLLVWSCAGAAMQLHPSDRRSSLHSSQCIPCRDGIGSAPGLLTTLRFGCPCASQPCPCCPMGRAFCVGQFPPRRCHCQAAAFALFSRGAIPPHCGFFMLTDPAQLFMPLATPIGHFLSARSRIRLCLGWEASCHSPCLWMVCPCVSQVAAEWLACSQTGFIPWLCLCCPGCSAAPCCLASCSSAVASSWAMFWSSACALLYVPSNLEGCPLFLLPQLPVLA